MMEHACLSGASTRPAPRHQQHETEANVTADPTSVDRALDHVTTATRVEAAGTPPKFIDEIVGRVNNDTAALSIAHMRSPAGWAEPGQTPEFEEYTYVLTGELHAEDERGVVVVRAGEAVHARAGRWVRYSTPDQSTEYVSVCVPAFSPGIVHRDPE